MMIEAAIHRKFRVLASRLDEHTRRVRAATEARALGYGGISSEIGVDGAFPSK